MYFVTKVVATVAHEGGHALIGMVLFQRVGKVRLRPDGSGETGFGHIPWLFDLFVTLAGYLGPSMFGLLAVPLLLHAGAPAVLWTSLAFLLLMLLVVRGWFGL